MTGRDKKMKRAWAAEPKELTTKMSRDWPCSRSLLAAKMRSLKMVARAGKNMEATNMPAYRGSTCGGHKPVSVATHACWGQVRYQSGNMHHEHVL